MVSTWEINMRNIVALTLLVNTAPQSQATSRSKTPDTMPPFVPSPVAHDFSPPWATTARQLVSWRHADRADRRDCSRSTRPDTPATHPFRSSSMPSGLKCRDLSTTSLPLLRLLGPREVEQKQGELRRGLHSRRMFEPVVYFKPRCFWNRVGGRCPLWTRPIR